MKRTLATVLCSALLFSSANASCKTGEATGPSDPSDLTNRFFTFKPSSPADVNDFNVNQITVATYNIQSGLAYSCRSDVANQADELDNCHYFSMQEVDINSTHCECNQPQTVADITGKTVLYLRTIYNQGGLYGHASGTLYEILESDWKLYTGYTSELRGLIAQRSQPPQLQGRDFWYITTHLQYNSLQLRTSHAQQAVAYAQNIRNNYPDAFIVLSGDFYSQFNDTDYATLAAFFTDSWVDFSGGYTAGSTYPSTKPIFRYDYIWFNAPSNFPVKVTNYEVVNVTDSDHAPLRVNFGFPTLYSSTGTYLHSEDPFFPEPTPTTSSTSGTSTTGGNITTPGTSHSSGASILKITGLSVVLSALAMMFV